MGRGDGTALEEAFDISETVRGSALASEWQEEATQYVLSGGLERHFGSSSYSRYKVWADLVAHRSYLPLLAEQAPERWEQLVRDLALYTMRRPANTREPDAPRWLNSCIDSTGFRRTSSALIVDVKGRRGKGSQSTHLRLDTTAEKSLCGLPVDPLPRSYNSLSQSRCKKCQEKLEKLIANGETISEELAGLIDNRNCIAIDDDAVEAAVERAKAAVAERLLAADLPEDPELLQQEITARGDSELRKTIAEQAVAYLYQLSEDDRLARLTFNAGKANYLDALRASIRRAYGSPCPWPDEKEMVAILDASFGTDVWAESGKTMLAHICARLFPDAVRELSATLGGMPFESTVEKVWQEHYPELLPQLAESQLLPV